MPRARHEWSVLAVVCLVIGGCGNAAPPTPGPGGTGIFDTPRAGASATLTVTPPPGTPTVAPTAPPSPSPTPSPTPLPTPSPSPSPSPTDTPSPSPAPTASSGAGFPTDEASAFAALLVASDLPAGMTGGEPRPDSQGFDDQRVAFDANGGLRVVSGRWIGDGTGGISQLFDFRFQFPTAAAAASYLAAAEAGLSEAVPSNLTLDTAAPPVGDDSRTYVGSVDVNGQTIHFYNFLFTTGNQAAKVFIAGTQALTQADATVIARAAQAHMAAATGAGPGSGALPQAAALVAAAETQGGTCSGPSPSADGESEWTCQTTTPDGTHASTLTISGDTASGALRSVQAVVQRVQPGEPIDEQVALAVFLDLAGRVIADPVIRSAASTYISGTVGTEVREQAFGPVSITMGDPHGPAGPESRTMAITVTDDGATPSPSPSASASASVPPEGAFPSTDEARILDHVPSAIVPTCERTDTIYEGELDSVRCHPDGTDGAFQADYTLFASKADMDTNYDADFARYGAKNAGDSCKTGPHDGTYTVSDTEAGRLFCAASSDGTNAFIEWTDDRVSILSYGYRTDLDWGKLFAWWLNAGPEK